MSDKITWYDKPQRFEVRLAPQSTLTYDEAIARIKQLEARLAEHGLALEPAALEAEPPLASQPAAQEVVASVKAARPAKPPAKPRLPARRRRRPLDGETTAIVFRSKGDGEVSEYVRQARVTNGTWYPTWSASRSSAYVFPECEAQDLVGWLQKSKLVDRTYRYMTESSDAR